MSTSTRGELRRLLDHAAGLASIPTPTIQQRMEHSTTLAKIAVLRKEAGIEGYSGEEEYRTKEFRKRTVDAWRNIARGEEVRDVAQEAGQVTVTPGGSAGSFVPTQFIYSDLQRMLATHSPLFDRDKVTLVETANGNTMQLPLVNDVSSTVDAEPITEAGSATDYTNIANLGNANSNTFVYRSRPIAFSLEFDDDAFRDWRVSVLEQVMADRIARGVGNDLATGTGSNNGIVGLVPQLQAQGIIPVIAMGENINTGSELTGADSIGTPDLENLFMSIPSPHRASPKAAWLMNDSVFNYLDAVVDRYGRPLEIIRYHTGQPTIKNKPVYIEPSLPNISASAIGTVVFGDLSRWVTRIVPAGNYIKFYREAPGLVENGLTGASLFFRAGGTLLSTGFGDNLSQGPIGYLAQHS